MLLQTQALNRKAVVDEYNILRRLYNENKDAALRIELKGLTDASSDVLKVEGDCH